MDWTFVYLMLGLKIPIAALFYIVWRAVKDVPEVPEAGSDEDGGSKDPRRHPREPFPKRPRRGPHGDPPLPAPSRTRGTVVAMSRDRDRA